MKMQVKSLHLSKPVRFMRTVTDFIEAKKDISINLNGDLVEIKDGELETIYIPLSNVLRLERKEQDATK